MSITLPLIFEYLLKIGRHPTNIKSSLTKKQGASTGPLSNGQS